MTQIPKFGPCWVVVYTKPRAEPVVESQLAAADYPVLLPYCRRARRSAPRLMFPRYLFVDIGGGRQWSPVWHAIGVCRIVTTTPDSFGIVPTEVVEDLRARAAKGIVLADLPSFSKDDRVRVNSGPWSGVGGLVVRDEGERCRILLDIVFGGRALSVPTRILEPG